MDWHDPSRTDYRYFDDDYGVSQRLSFNNNDDDDAGSDQQYWISFGGDTGGNDPFGVFTALLVTTMIVSLVLLVIVPALVWRHHRLHFAHYNSHLHQREQELEIKESRESQQPQQRRHFYGWYYSWWLRRADPVTSFGQWLMGWILLSILFVSGLAFLTVYFDVVAQVSVETTAWQTAEATGSNNLTTPAKNHNQDNYYHGPMTVQNVTVLQSEYLRRMPGTTWNQQRVFKTMLDLQVEWPCKNDENSCGGGGRGIDGGGGGGGGCGGSKLATKSCTSRLVYTPCTAVVPCLGKSYEEDDQQEEQVFDPNGSPGSYARPPMRPSPTQAPSLLSSPSDLVSPGELHMSAECSLDELYAAILQTEQCWQRHVYNDDKHTNSTDDASATGAVASKATTTTTLKMELYGDSRTCQAYFTPPMAVPGWSKQLAFAGVCFVAAGWFALFIFVCNACDLKGSGGVIVLSPLSNNDGDGRGRQLHDSGRRGGGNGGGMSLDEILTREVARRRGYDDDLGTEVGSIGSLESEDVLVDGSVDIENTASERIVYNDGRRA